MRRLAPLVLAALVLAASPTPAAAGDEPSAAVSRALQPVVLLGAQLPELSVAPHYVERPPAPFEEESRDGVYLPLPVVTGHEEGWPVDHIGAFRWTGSALEPIPVQVDERFVRYLTNYASGFGAYSQSDMELTYAFDVEGTRRTGEAPGDPWTAALADPAQPTTPDPVRGLDHDDEIVLMAADAGPRAPAVPPRHHEVEILDPLSGARSYVYLAALDAPFASPRAYVHYARDADADRYVRSNHGSYGGAPGGACYPGDGVDAPWGERLPDCAHRRPKDSATVTTGSYQFHYSGRWKLDGLLVKQPDGSWSESLVDRWKGRAFQQREGNAANIGGFEDENDWTRSSVTLGERVGPVRALRETWGADSGTHVTRLDVFYAQAFHQVYRMRVHPIPPDGVYAFWDHRAGMVDTYYTPLRAGGVPVDGANDELYGLNSEWQQDVLGKPYFTVDAPDPTLSGFAANEMWDQVSGPYGSLVTLVRTPQPLAGALLPYYRDDAAFDDGTGHDPAPAGAGQGSFGAHGIHFFATSDTDNAFLPAPVNEFVADVRQYVLEGRQPNVGERVATLDRAPLVAHVVSEP